MLSAAGTLKQWSCRRVGLDEGAGSAQPKAARAAGMRPGRASPAAGVVVPAELGVAPEGECGRVSEVSW
jgi:hypothetical protein